MTQQEEQKAAPAPAPAPVHTPVSTSAAPGARSTAPPASRHNGTTGGGSNSNGGTRSRPLRVAILDAEDEGRGWKAAAMARWRTALADGPGDSVTVYHCPSGDLPDPSTAASYDLVLIGGSHYDSYDDSLDWVRRLMDLIPRYAASGSRLAGCCFGHQILARALGGAVGKNPSGRFVLRVEDVRLLEGALREHGLQEPLEQALAAGGAGGAWAAVTQQQQQQQQQGASKAGLAPAARAEVAAGGSSVAGRAAGAEPGLTLQLVESHGDQVLRLPPGATLLGTSGTASVEMWAMGPNVLAFQFHPELTGQDACDTIWTTQSSNGRLSPEEAAASKESLLGRRQHSEAILALLRYYMRHGAAPSGNGSGGHGPGSSDAQWVPAASVGGTLEPGVAGGRSSGACSKAEPPLSSEPAASHLTPPSSQQVAAPASKHSHPAPLTSSHPMLPASSQPVLPVSSPLSNQPAPAITSSAQHSGHSSVAGKTTGVGAQTASQPAAASDRSAHWAEREATLGASAHSMCDTLRSAVDTGLASSVAQYRELAAANQAAADRYGTLGDVASAVADFGVNTAAKGADLSSALGALADIEAQLDRLMLVVDKLDESSRELAQELGVPEGSGGGGTASALWKMLTTKQA